MYSAKFLENSYTGKRSVPLYIHNVYRIAPNSSSIIFKESSGIFPESFKNHVVYNVGRTEVYAETIYGTAFGWIGNAGSATVKPKETKTIDNGGRSYYKIGLKIHNKTDTHAIVCAEYSNGTYPGGNDGDLNLDYDAYLKALVVFGVKFVPYVGPTISGLLNAFWPKNEDNVWEQIKGQVKNLVDQSILNAVQAILSGDVRHYQERIKVLDDQINGLSTTKDVANYYMNLAQDLVGFELKFTYPEDKHNSFALLPMYTAVVMMKMNYYITGILKAEEFGISDEDVQSIKKFAKTLIEDENGVITYINAMYKERVDDVYNTRDVRDIYNAMMHTRSFIAINGLEYIPLWKQLLVDPSSADHAYVDSISYSEFHGRVTPKLCIEATPENLEKPLTPQLIDGKRNRLTAVELYIWRINNGAGAPKIGGLKVYFENGDTNKMGWDSNETHYVDFKGANLTKLRVAGSGALDTFTFHFSDGREESYGTASDSETIFELKEHHIASIFLSNDDTQLAGQAANVVVSYIQD